MPYSDLLHNEGAPHGRWDPVPADELELMGKYAAVKYAERGVPLTSAVINSINLTGKNLNDDQARRVTEFANQFAWQKDFEKMGSVKTVSFKDGPADPAEVIQSLRSGSRPTEYTHTDHSFDAQPTAYVRGQESVDDPIAAIFGKTASANPYPDAHPEKGLLETRAMLTQAKDEVLSKLAGLDVRFDSLVEGMGHEVKQAALRGSSSRDIVDVMGSQATSGHLLKLAWNQVRPKLREEGYHRMLSEKEMIKAAGRNLRLVNPGHPLAQATRDFCKVALDRAACHEAVREFDGQLARLDSAIKRTWS